MSTKKLKKETVDYWNKFLRENSNLEYLKNIEINAWSFGNSSAMADELVNLVLKGRKTATCSLFRVYREFDEEAPMVGSYSVILDGADLPKCIVFLTDTFIRKFNEIDENHAFEEGEGDRSLEYWRSAHIEFFSNYENFSEDELILCERFKVVSRY